jgi:hypothetical protein
MFLAMIEAITAWSYLIHNVLNIAPVINILLPDKQPTTFIGQLPKSLLLNNLKFTPVEFH